ncbi:AAA family ATPase [Pseudomonas chlororaphis]|uniref:AAA family ATPase n=1 Tax=Pseudomonas chlororaphis TaxID=587753 RepID=UPI00352A3422
MSDSIEFTSLEVENIFAYEGLSRIDLSGCTAERNMVVIAGRNGAGKTSLLNAIKLLLLGSANEEIRRVGFGGGALTQKQFVLGQPGRWYGVFNRVARNANDRARAMLCWTEGALEVRVERIFTPSNTTLGYTEQLIVKRGTEQLALDEAELYLSGLAPSEIVPFYFFDGEQVQSFADAEEGRERTEIERLLKLSFIGDIIRELEVYGRNKRRSGLPADAQSEVVHAENDLRSAEAQIESFHRSRVDIEAEYSELDRKRTRLDDQRNALRTGISESDRRRMVNRIEVIRAQSEKLDAELSELLAPEAPWLTNLSAVRSAYKLLDDGFVSSADASLSAKLHGELPETLKGSLAQLSPPVVLTHSQYENFALDIKEALVQRGLSVGANISPLLAAMDPRQAKSLRDRYLVWMERGPSLVVSHVEKLRLLRQLTQEAEQAQRDLDEAELTSDEARHQFESLSQSISELDQQIRDFGDRLAELKVKEQQAWEAAGQARQRIGQCEEKYASVTRENCAYQLSVKVRRALEAYRDRRRTYIRESVEAHLNERIGILLAPSQLIKSVTLDDWFVMKYFDEQSEEVARRSISAGMRQLVAMGMLWALRDEAGRDLPVVIDTPLGRIDRENRALLMNEYFPKAGKPLLLLPTNSEMDEDVLCHLGERIRRRYEIRNDGGTRARIVEIDKIRYDGISR